MVKSKPRWNLLNMINSKRQISKTSITLWKHRRFCVTGQSVLNIHNVNYYIFLFLTNVVYKAAAIGRPDTFQVLKGLYLGLGYNVSCFIDLVLTYICLLVYKCSIINSWVNICKKLSDSQSYQIFKIPSPSVKAYLKSIWPFYKCP